MRRTVSPPPMTLPTLRMNGSFPAKSSSAFVRLPRNRAAKCSSASGTRPRTTFAIPSSFLAPIFSGSSHSPGISTSRRSRSTRTPSAKSISASPITSTRRRCNSLRIESIATTRRSSWATRSRSCSPRPASRVPRFIFHRSSFIVHRLPSLMRIDHDRRQIVCSVGDLVYPTTYRRIGVERGDGFRRMWLGQDVPSRRAEVRAAEDGDYRAEVHVVHRSERRGWSVTVTGRIDGLSINAVQRRVCIEEVKSIHFDLELEALYRPEKLQRHLYQLLLYSLFLSTQPELADI